MTDKRLEDPSIEHSTDTHALGYRQVDDSQHVGVLIAAMQATSRWDATKMLRSWERDHLRLGAGERLIDVGCGLGEAAVALASGLGPNGEVVGIDTSSAMLEVARSQSNNAVCPVRFSVGNALTLDEPSGSFDAARSERTLQWLTDPQTAVNELARVLRPGGRISLIDTDWSTLRLDVGDNTIAAMVQKAMRIERRRASNVGSRLGDLVRRAGFDVVLGIHATQVWTSWDPDRFPAPDGCFSMRSLAADLVGAGLLDPEDVDHFVSTIHNAARNYHFSMSLTMYAVIATAQE
jgi:SAM-dependent methyltransferase